MLRNRYMKVVFVFFSLILLLAFVSPAGAANTSEGKVSILDRIERLQDYIAEETYNKAIWFDNFFGDERSEEESLPGTTIKWRNDLIFTENNKPQWERRLHFDVSIPKTEQRFRLFFTSRDVDDIADVNVEDTTDAGYSGDRLKLGYTFIQETLQNFRVNIGWIDAEVRYRYTHSLTDRTKGSFTQSAYWDEGDGVGAVTRIDLEFFPDKKTLIRWSSSGTAEEKTKGYQWDSGLVYFHQLSKRNGVILDASLSGNTNYDYTVDNYHIGMRFRRKFSREWLFYELATEHNWLRESGGVYSPELKFTFRLEIQFGYSQ